MTHDINAVSREDYSQCDFSRPRLCSALSSLSGEQFLSQKSALCREIQVEVRGVSPSLFLEPSVMRSSN